MKNLFKVNIFTYVFLILSMLSGYFRNIIIIYFILIVHELGHFICMKYYNIKVNKINIYPYGGMIDSDMLINTNSIKVLIISFLFLYILIFLLFKINIVSKYYYTLFSKFNLYIILFNLLPIYPLDGFKILNSILELFFSFKLSINISVIINYIFIILFIIYLFIFKINNYIIITFLIVSFINYIKNIKYIINKFYIERIIYDLKYNGLISVKIKENMYKNKYNYINGVEEKIYLKKNI